MSQPAHAYVQLSQAQAKELILGFMDEVKSKLGEGKKDIALAECVATRELLLRKFVRPPDDLVSAIKETCQPLFEEVKVPAASAKVALEKYGERISELSFLMTVGPLGGGYDGSRKDIERVIAAAGMEAEGFKVATDFVALLPRPSIDEEVAKAGVDTEELKLRRLELWNLFWGGTFAKEVIDQTIVPQLAATVKKAAESLSSKERMTVTQAESDAAEAAELLKKAKPDAPEVKEAEGVVEKLRARIDALYKEEVEKQRMPADRYKGSDRGALEAMAKKSMGSRYKSVLRVVINGEGWSTPETVAWWDGNNAVHWSRTKGLGGGYAAVETTEKGLGQFRMVPFSFSQSWDWGTRKFNPTMISVGGWGPPIMKKNINK